MKKFRQRLEKQMTILTVAIGIEIFAGVVLFAFLLQRNRLIAFLVLILSVAEAVMMFFVRHWLSVSEKLLQEAQKELAAVKADNELLKLSLGQEEEEYWKLPDSDSLPKEFPSQEDIAASEEDSEESVYRGFGFVPEDLVSYFGKKKAGNSSSAVYRAMSKMDARIRELEAANQEMVNRLSHAEKKGNT